MNNISNYIFNLKKLIANKEIEKICDQTKSSAFDSILRSEINITEMRRMGCFFTGEDLSKIVCETLDNRLDNKSIILDPTCGTGNLLLEASRRMDIKTTLSSTLRDWGTRLWGFDTYLPFITIAKLRLISEALQRGAINDCTIEQACSLLTEIKLQDAMDINFEQLHKVTHVVMNPPFCSWPISEKKFWGTGKVNAAGIIFQHYLNNLQIHTKISAILPDVLRSGSRYKKFRKFVSTHTKGYYKIWGRFDAKTDIDVFVLSCIKDNPEDMDLWDKNPVEHKEILGEFCSINVGPLVAYRAPQEGKVYPYFHPKNTAAWEIISSSSEYRKFTGKVFTPPLVVVKRTSSPRDKYRATASIINMDTDVAIENHLIVIVPHDKSLESCTKIIDTLKSNDTNNFLNDKIRLRHLTINAVKSIPIAWRK